MAPKIHCAAPENSHTLPTERIGIFLGGGGVGGSVRPKNLKKSLKLYWNFQRGGGVSEKIPSVGEVWIFSGTTNFLLTEREGRTGEYWPEVEAVQTSLRSVHTKTTEGQYSPVQLEQARLVSSLLYGTRVMLVSKLPAFENKKYTSYDHFHGNGPYGKIPTKKEPIRTPGFTPRLPCHIINIINTKLQFMSNC